MDNSPVEAVGGGVENESAQVSVPQFPPKKKWSRKKKIIMWGVVGVFALTVVSLAIIFAAAHRANVGCVGENCDLTPPPVVPTHNKEGVVLTPQKNENLVFGTSATISWTDPMASDGSSQQYLVSLYDSNKRLVPIGIASSTSFVWRVGATLQTGSSQGKALPPDFGYVPYITLATRGTDASGREVAIGNSFNIIQSSSTPMVQMGSDLADVIGGPSSFDEGASGVTLGTFAARVVGTDVLITSVRVSFVVYATDMDLILGQETQNRSLLPNEVRFYNQKTGALLGTGETDANGIAAVPLDVVLANGSPVTISIKADIPASNFSPGFILSTKLSAATFVPQNTIARYSLSWSRSIINPSMVCGNGNAQMTLGEAREILLSNKTCKSEVISSDATFTCSNGRWSVPLRCGGTCSVDGGTKEVVVAEEKCQNIFPAKPVIYLYPTHTQDVTVQLHYQGILAATYPAYDSTISGWDVTASPDGTLINHADGKQYSYLFWEGNSAYADYDLSTGFVVKGSDTAAFLQTTLAHMGLTPREYNEFIVYWYPKMKDNPYNLIHFAGKSYTDIAPLTITPAPDSLLRVFMVYRPLQEPIVVQPQTIAPFQRHGFTVVEWGGTEVE